MNHQEQITPLVCAWIPQQRWFAGKGRDATISAAPLADLTSAPEVTIWIAVVDYADGATETYQVPLVVHDAPEHTLEHVLLGSIGTEYGTRWVYDALHDKDST